MIAAQGVSLQYGGRVLFNDVNINFTKGNCYGLIGANGAGKSTFLKILAGELEPNKGSVFITPGERMAVLKQDHFLFDEFEVVECVLYGHKRLYDIRKEKDELYMKEDFSDEDGIKAAELEGEFAAAAVHDEVNHLRGFGVFGVLVLQSGVVVNREYGLVGFRVEGFHYNTHEVVAGFGKGLRNTEYGELVHGNGVVRFLIFVVLRVGENTVRVVNVAQFLERGFKHQLHDAHVARYVFRLAVRFGHEVVRTVVAYKVVDDLFKRGILHRASVSIQKARS